MQKLLFSIVTLLLSAASFAYPITPRPLRKLVMESQYIIHGTVLEKGSLPTTGKNDSHWERDYAVIEVYETWQGRPLMDTITVYYTARMLCPAPPVYIKGEEIIAFLNKREDEDGYETTALSYGVKYGLGKEGIEIYRLRIEEIQQILTIQDPQKQGEKIIDWLVTCAMSTYTRWEGVYELSPGSDFMSYYDQDDPVRRDIFLNSRQKEKLLDILLAIDTLQYEDMGIVNMVAGLNDQALLDFLKSRLWRMDNEYRWPARDIMLHIVHLTGNEELEELYKKFSEMLYEAEHDSERSNILSAFRQKMENAALKSTASAATAVTG